VTSDLDHYRPGDPVAGNGIAGLGVRYRELGRLRMGQRVDTGRVKNGRKVYRPEKLEVWRFTSTDWRLIKRAAELYGGEPSRWEEAPGWNTDKQSGVRQFQVTTDANDVPVMLPPEIALSQAMEAWTAGECLRRCDGQWEQISGAECLCSDEESQVCKPTTRLSVLLADMPGLGVWRLETHGWYAARELVPMVRLAATFGTGQRFRLRIDPRQRQTKDDGEKVTYLFGVPVLDTDLTPGELLATTPEMSAAGRQAPGLERGDPGMAADPTSGAGEREPASSPSVRDLRHDPAPDLMSDPGEVPPDPGSGPPSGEADGGNPPRAPASPDPTPDPHPREARFWRQPDGPVVEVSDPTSPPVTPGVVPGGDTNGVGSEVHQEAREGDGETGAGPTPPTGPSPVLAWCEMYEVDIRHARIYLRKTFGEWFGDLKDRKDLQELRGERADRAIAYLDA